MRTFFTQTARESQLFLVNTRINYLKTRVANLQQSLDQLTASSQNIENLITEVTQRYNKLSINAGDQKQQELDQAKQEGSTLEYRRQQTFQNYQDALQKKTQAEAQLKSSLSGINDTVQKLADVNRRIGELDNIINSPRPQPQYSTTGGTCIHGHVNCPNLPIVNPGQTILVNEQEIARYDQLVQRATEERYRLIVKQRDLMQQESAFRKEYLQAQTDLFDAQINVPQLEEQLQTLRQTISENQQLQKKLEAEYEYFLQEKADSQPIAENLQNTINQLRSQQVNVNNQVAEVRNNLSICELELQRFQDRAEQLQSEIAAEKTDRIRATAEREFKRQLELEAIVRQEVQQETSGGFFSNNSTPSSISGDSPNNRNDQDNPNDAKSLVNEWADKLVEMGGSAALRAGAIREHIKQNVRFIKNISNKVPDDFNKQLKPAFPNSDQNNHDNSPQNN